MNKINNKIQQGGFSPLWFTLIEIMIWILISSMIIIIWFQALNSILIWKVKLIESTNIEKESFSFMQKFFEEIKSGGLIDYEEYFNRKVVWNTTYLSGHFDKNTWFWNFGKLWKPWVFPFDIGKWFYHCRSTDWVKMWTWCIDNFNTIWDVSGKPQSYGQYSFHFIDYNSNYDDDWGDENWDWKIIWDDDDEHLWVWPKVFESWTWVTELYLIGADKKNRTFFRWTVKQDPYINNSSYTCNTSDWITFTGSWCLGTIEFLKLEWKDWWFDHDISNTNKIWEYDWVIDTWLIDKDFSENKNKNSIRVIAWSDLKNYWLPLFPDSINVKSFDIRAYPNKDIKQAWKEQNIDVAPYIRVNMILTPSFKVKKKIKWKIPEFNISTTINLTDIFSR